MHYNIAYYFQPDMLRRNGYGCKTVNVMTKDGYINTLHRILPRSRLNTQTIPKNKTKPIFLQHGLLGTSADYVVGSPEKSLGKNRNLLIDNLAICLSI